MKTIEAQLHDVYRSIKKDVPNLHCITFTISEFSQIPPYLHGFIHMGEECEEFKNVEELGNLVSDKVSSQARNEILYRRYDKEEGIDD